MCLLFNSLMTLNWKILKYHDNVSFIILLSFSHLPGDGTVVLDYKDLTPFNKWLTEYYKKDVFVF
jgi:hypothetical protein